MDHLHFQLHSLKDICGWLRYIYGSGSEKFT
jgi:hypothetical protein